MFLLRILLIIIRGHTIQYFEGNANPLVHKGGKSYSQNVFSLKSLAYSFSCISFSSSHSLPPALPPFLLPSLPLFPSLLRDGLGNNQLPLMVRFLMEPRQCPVMSWKGCSSLLLTSPFTHLWGMTVLAQT